ncbi:MAG: hypothetical protein E6H76_15320 [Betaproteobacteria bacterium]|nr:MAG: hypothetical protein E6H76_15320 [Betaproteobacteria bacterium]
MNDGAAGAEDAFGRLAAYAGILPEYLDVRHERHVTSRETQRTLLAAMGIPVATEADAIAALATHDARTRQRLLPPVAVFRADDMPLSVELAVPSSLAERPLAWLLRAERGESWSGSVVPTSLQQIEARAIAGASFARYRFALPIAAATLGEGYHRFELQAVDDAASAATTLILAPPRCYEPSTLAGGGRVWGPAVQLYSIRSRRNWGVGDLTDLKRVTEFAAAAGAGIVGLNPLHALSSVAPQHASPYNPSTRLFGNPIYIDVEAVPEFAHCEAARRAVANAGFQAKLRWLREGELVGYRVSFAAKREIMELLYRCFRESHRGREDARERAFAAYLASGGEALRRHALFEAIAGKLHDDGIAAASSTRSSTPRARPQPHLALAWDCCRTSPSASTPGARRAGPIRRSMPRGPASARRPIRTTRRDRIGDCRRRFRSDCAMPPMHLSSRHCGGTCAQRGHCASTT